MDKSFGPILHLVQAVTSLLHLALIRRQFHPIPSGLEGEAHDDHELALESDSPETKVAIKSTRLKPATALPQLNADTTIPSLVPAVAADQPYIYAY